MRIMLCIPTFLLFHDEEHLTHECVLRRQEHLAAFKVLCEQLETLGHDVYCALKTYAWRLSDFVPASEAVKRDWAEVQAANHVIACPVVDGESSRGVHVEVGWATALGKPVTLLLHRPRTKHTVLITGLRSQDKDFTVKNVYYEHAPQDACDTVLKQFAGETQ